MPDNKTTTPTPRSSNGNGSVPWKFVTYMGMIVVPLATMIAYFFASQAIQDSAQAATNQNVERIDAVQKSHERMLEELKAQSADTTRDVQAIQTQLGKIDTNQTLTREFLERQLTEIKGDIKEIKQSRSP